MKMVILVIVWHNFVIYFLFIYRVVVQLNTIYVVYHHDHLIKMSFTHRSMEQAYMSRFCTRTVSPRRPTRAAGLPGHTPCPRSWPLRSRPGNPHKRYTTGSCRPFWRSPAHRPIPCSYTELYGRKRTGCVLTILDNLLVLALNAQIFLQKKYQ